MGGRGGRPRLAALHTHACLGTHAHTYAHAHTQAHTHARAQEVAECAAPPPGVPHHVVPNPAGESLLLVAARVKVRNNTT